MALTADWDEIKRLAADFQKAQLSTTTQRLSERNCVEIVSKLIELKLIDVIFTTDGKEYLTHQQLVKEIKDELIVQGGRINVVDLAKELNVDLNQINNCVGDVVKSKDVLLVSGYLITQDYLEKVAREINEKLQLQGQLSVNELTLQYDLPADLLQHNILEHYHNKIIQGTQDASDPRIFYTDEYINQTKAKMRGALIGLLKPTPITVILNHCNVNERLFMSLIDKVNAPGVLTGRHAGCLYVPSCYSKSQNEWVINFWKQNHYLEYDALSRLGISDPKTFIKKLLPTENLIYLSSCAIGGQLQNQLGNALDECIASKSYLDVASHLPSVLSDADIESMIETLIKENANSVVVFEQTVFSNNYIDVLQETCLPLTEKNADNFVKSGKYQKFYMEQQISKSIDNSKQEYVDHKAERRDERRRKAASGKGGGGTQGRETKTKAVKKHGKPSKHAKDDSDSDNEVQTKKQNSVIEIVSVEEIENIIKTPLENEGLDELITTVAEYLHGKLNQIALVLAKDKANKLLQDVGQSRKQTHSSTQDKINILMNDIKMYEKGFKLLPTDQQGAFAKYLLKTVGSDVLVEFCKYAASQCNLVFSESLSIEQRNKIVKDLPEDFSKPFQTLIASLSEQNLENFYQAVDLCLAPCEMILKKADKKKDKILIQNHREKLISELETCEDPALCLHIAVLVIFTMTTQTMLHASGRQVPVIMNYLKTQLNEELYSQLQKYHELVSKYLVGSEEEKLEIELKLRAEMPALKKIPQDLKMQK